MALIREVDYGTPKRVSETLVTLEIDGKQVPPEKLRGTTLTVKGDRYIVTTKGGAYEVTFKLDPSQKPKAIDMFLPNGTDAPKRSPGIYRIDGDTFRAVKPCASPWRSTFCTPFRKSRSTALRHRRLNST